MKARLSALFCTLGLIQTVHATILPKNDLYLEDDIHAFANMTEVEFGAIIDEVIEAYRPIIKKIHGAEVNANKLWTDSTVNASAQQFSDSDWQVNMYGGLARRPEITRDGFTLVVCHELGHHIGGFPFYGDNVWAASEGQADYYATQACARYLWQKQTSVNAQSRATVPAIAKQKCDAQWTTVADQNLCYRTVLAGESLAKLLAAVKPNIPVPTFESQDTNVVSSTDFTHPAPQCRLDTYVAGSTCTIPFDVNLIPGKRLTMRNSLASEEIASELSCTEAGAFTEAVRPRCWFKPRISTLGVRVQSMALNSSQGVSGERLIPGTSGSLQVKLVNRSKLDASNVTASLVSSHSGVTVSRQSVSYGTFGSREERSSSPFSISVQPGTQCGKTTTLTVNVSGTLNGAAFTHTHEQIFAIGTSVTSKAGLASVERGIPDNSAAGINSVITSALASNAVRARVTFKVDHRIMSDIGATLISPTGKRYPIEVPPRRGGMNTVSTVVEVDEARASGAWTLNISDLAEKDVGKFLNWELSLDVGSCSQSQLAWR